VPTDRRALQATPNSATAPVDPTRFRRPEQPPKHLNDVQRATPSNAWRSDAGRNDRGGNAVRSGGRNERAASGGGESRMSGSHSQSSRAGAQSSGRSGGEARMSSGSRNGRGGGLSSRP
jgi:hypothetical protein